MDTIVQKIKNKCSSPIDRAVKYYSIISALNHLRFTGKDIQLLAFIAINGSISLKGAKDSFIEMFGGSKPSIGNIVWKLSKKGFLVYENRNILLHPQLRMDFSVPLVLQILMSNDN